MKKSLIFEDKSKKFSVIFFKIFPDLFYYDSWPYTCVMIKTFLSYSSILRHVLALLLPTDFFFHYYFYCTRSFLFCFHPFLISTFKNKKTCFYIPIKCNSIQQHSFLYICMYIIFYSYACMYHPLHEPELQPLTLALLNFVIAIQTIFYILLYFTSLKAINAAYQWMSGKYQHKNT